MTNPLEFPSQTPDAPSGVAGVPVRLAARHRPTLALAGALVAALVTVLGSILPWATLLGYSKLGIEGDGLITLLFAVLAGVAAVWGAVSISPRALKVTGITITVAGALITLIGLIDLSDVSRSGVSVGFGLVLTTLAGIATLTAGVLTLLVSRRP